MSKPAPDERVVYLALKSVLQGPERKSKTVKQVIQKNKTRPEIADLIREYNVDKVGQIAKKLLADRVFESTLVAKLRFPEVFEVSPNQTADRSISELAAARNEDAAIQNVIEGRQADPSPVIAPVVVPEVSIIRETAEVATVTENESKQTRPVEDRATEITSTSLYPVYLPFDVQHRLLNKVQTILERACFAFATSQLSDVLQREGWNCAESVELNRWPKIFLAHQTAFEPGRIDKMGKPLADVMNTMAHLRHAAVHRLRFSATRIKQFLSDGLLLVELLDAGDYTSALSTIRRQTQGAIEDLERNKDLLELQMAETKRQYSMKRAELECQETEELNNAFKSDTEYSILVGRSLEQAFSTPATVIYSPSTTEDESCSDLEPDFARSEEATGSA